MSWPLRVNAVARIVHDRAEVVGADVVAVGDVLVEVVLAAGLDVGPDDPHDAVAVLAALLVPQPDGVADLVDRGAEAAAGAERDHLHAVALHADRRPAAVALLERHPVGELRGIGGGALDEADARVGVPMGDRLVDQRAERRDAR